MRLADKSQAYQIVVVQLATSLIAGILLLTLGWVHAYSGFTGGVIAALANAYFAAKVFAHYRAQEPGKLVARFYSAELQKLILTGLLFAGVIILIKPLSAGALFGIFLLMQFVPMLVTHFVN